MKPDYDRAATKAMEILVENNVTETPIIPTPILLNCPGVRVMSFTKMADMAGMERKDLVPLFGSNTDAETFHLDMGINDVKYVVVYNMRLPYEIIWRAIARELGHIVLGHDGVTRPADVRLAEAMCFAHHLLSPRPIIHQIQESGIPMTANVLVATTGCSEDCADDMANIPGARVPNELNAKVRDLFSRGIREYIKFYKASQKVDRSPVLDLGSFMDNYKE